MEEFMESGESSHSLYSLLRACQRGQRFAVVGSHDDIDETITPFLNKLYVDDTREDELLREFFVEEYQDDGKLLIISGSAGDGKSALLSKGYISAQEAGHTSVTESRINMDATAADTKHQQYQERLRDFFDTVLADAKAGEGPRSGLAINYGLAVDFFQREKTAEESEEYEMIWEALQASREQTDGIYRTDSTIMLNLSQRELYSTHPDTFGQGLLLKILDRFGVDNEPESPLYDAYRRESEDCPAGEDCPLHYNVSQFADPEVRRRIAQVVAGWNIVTGSYFNPRGMLDLVASILLPDVEDDLLDREAECPIGEAVDAGDFTPTADDILWNRVFNVLAEGEEKMASQVDPLSRSSISLDTRVLRWRGKRDELLDELSSPPGSADAEMIQLIRTTLRYQYLHESEDIDGLLETDSFTEYRAALTLLNQDNPPRARELGDDVGKLFSKVKDSLRGWSGQQRGSNEIEFVDARRSPAYRFLSRWGDPIVDTELSERETRKQTVPGRISIQLDNPTATDEKPIRIPLTYELYQLMEQINQGYTPSAVDIEQSEAVTQIKSKISDLTRKRNFVKVVNRSNAREFTVEQNEYGAPTVKKKGSWE
jgi:hypothetical protein